MVKTFSDYNIEIPAIPEEEVDTTCPECSPGRTKKNDRCLSVNVITGTWCCHHCGWSGGLGNGNGNGIGHHQNTKSEKTYSKPSYQWPQTLPGNIHKYIVEDRCIPEGLIKENRIGFSKGAITFPFSKSGEVVNIKYRKLDKSDKFPFWQEKGCEKVLYRYDHINDDLTIITEGEFDTMAVQAAGFDNVVSVPDGAPAINAKNYNSKFEYLENYKDRLDQVKEFIFAGDNDEPGRKLIDELASRLGPGKCKIVEWPEKCKDANDVLVKHGAEKLAECIENARPCQVGSDSSDSNNEWDQPILFDTVETQNISSKLLPGIYGEFAGSLAESMEVPEAMTTMGVLGVVSSAVSHRFKVSPKSGWEETINIYSLTALEPGNAKSPAKKKLTKPIIDWEFAQAEILGPEIKRSMSERKTREKVIEKMRSKASSQTDPDLLRVDIREIENMEAELKDPPVLPRIFVTDTTPEQLAYNTFEQDGRFAVISDEGGIMKVIAGLYSGGNSNTDIILKGIDGGATRVRRRDRSFDLNPILTFCLFCQPSVVEKMGSESAFDGNGMVERFLYTLPSSKLGYRTHRTDSIPASLQNSYNQSIKDLLDKYLIQDDDNQEKWCLKLSGETLNEWREFQDHIETQLRPGGKLYPILGWGGKICGYSLRIAGLLHVMEHGHERLSISLETMANALEISALLVDHALAAFALMGLDGTRKKNQRVIDWIQVNGQARFNKRDCLRDLKTEFRKVDELDHALDDLLSRHIIKGPVKVETGGRPSLFFDVNPAMIPEEN